MNKLVGDIGATGSSWAYLDSGNKVRPFSGPGYNPISQGKQGLEDMISVIKQHIGDAVDLKVWYYGAGAGNQHFSDEIAEVFRTSLPLRQIEVGSDLLASARALCGDEPGTVCILGTGSNVGMYNGNMITRQAASLGYPLGDEGSGTDLGRHLVRAYYYDLMPPNIRATSEGIIPADRYDFLSKLRNSNAPNRYLASFTSLVHKLKDDPWMNDLIMSAFGDFVRIHLGYHKKYVKIKFSGSIAFYFCDELEQCLAINDLKLGEVMQSPMESLVSYHKNNDTL